jgi:hypothetical protein
MPRLALMGSRSTPVERSKYATPSALHPCIPDRYPFRATSSPADTDAFDLEDHFRECFGKSMLPSVRLSLRVMQYTFSFQIPTLTCSNGLLANREARVVIRGA